MFFRNFGFANGPEEKEKDQNANAFGMDDDLGTLTIHIVTYKIYRMKIFHSLLQ